MTRRFPLAGLLRVRRVQEDQAAGAVGAARAAQAAAARELARREALVGPPPLTGARGSAAWVGVMAARVSLAGEAAAARGDVAAAQQQVADRLDAWSAARAARRGVERLAERHAAAVQAADARAEQRALDDRGRPTPAVPTADHGTGELS